jgi:hypothetical protein
MELGEAVEGVWVAWWPRLYFLNIARREGCSSTIETSLLCEDCERTIHHFVVFVSYFLFANVTSKHPKPASGKPHLQSDKKRSREYKTEISGGIFVRGEIETRVPPSEVEKNDAIQSAQNTRENSRYLVEKITLFVVIFYGAVTAWMAVSSQNLVTLTKDQFTKDQRPYVWITRPVFDPIQAGVQLTGKISMKNFGKTPALNVHTTFQIFPGPNAFEKADQLFSLRKLKIKFGGAPTGTLFPYSPNDDETIATESVDSFQHVMSEKDLTVLQDKGGAVLAGIIWYEDMSGNSYSTDICVFRGAAGAGVGACAVHNEIH